eukprot:TRINITY_DN2393_c0_g1_i2.p2 TRINITY_DN2393_c0_g1~~TRINITY_DN2393_c0_g1_i2.p2  ORF type:complete len:206 (-),score=-2.13 TRINITY_DN2393_c0_g1_i2:110-727(-)
MILTRIQTASNRLNTSPLRLPLFTPVTFLKPSTSKQTYHTMHSLKHFTLQKESTKLPKTRDQQFMSMVSLTLKLGCLPLNVQRNVSRPKDVRVSPITLISKEENVTLRPVCLRMVSMLRKTAGMVGRSIGKREMLPSVIAAASRDSPVCNVQKGNVAKLTVGLNVDLYGKMAQDRQNLLICLFGLGIVLWYVSESILLDIGKISD